jgi:hypothetical protein
MNFEEILWYKKLLGSSNVTGLAALLEASSVGWLQTNQISERKK